MLIGRVVDRDEAVEESVFAEAFTEMAERWKVRVHCIIVRLTAIAKSI